MLYLKSPAVIWHEAMLFHQQVEQSSMKITGDNHVDFKYFETVDENANLGMVPRYIITLHELLAHTPHDHVERKSLQNARQQLEDLSRQMHDELPNEKSKTPRSKLAFKTEKEVVRQCFLFSNHLIIATRTSSGKLHLVPDIGKIPLADALLIEDPNENPDDEVSSVCSVSSQSTTSEASGTTSYHNRDFKIIVEVKSISHPGQLSVHLVAPTVQEKAAWISDIIQCLDNVQFNDMMRPTMTDSSSISLPQSLKNDPKLFKDEADIRFSRTLNSCKVPQIRYATPERLLQRLTEPQGSVISLEVFQSKEENTLQLYDDRRRSSFSPRRTSGASSVSGYGSEMSDRDRSHSYDSQGHRHWKATLYKYEEESQEAVQPKVVRHSPTHSKVGDTLAPPTSKGVSIRVDSAKDTDKEICQHLTIPKVAASSSSETLTDVTVLSAPCSPSNLSSVTLVGSSPSENGGNDEAHSPTKSPTKSGTKSPIKSPTRSPTKSPAKSPIKAPSPTKDQSAAKADVQKRPPLVLKQDTSDKNKSVPRGVSVESEDQSEEHSYSQTHRASCSSSRSASISASTAVLQSYYGSRRSTQDGDSTARSSFQHDSPQKPSKAGVVITSFRQSKRRRVYTLIITLLNISCMRKYRKFHNSTSGSSNPRDISPGRGEDDQTERNRHKESVMSTACTMRVLNVLRHWISKHSQDFENDYKLKMMTVEFLDDIIYSPNLLPAEHKAAAQLLRLLTKDDPESSKTDILKLLTPPVIPSKETIESLSALEIAEQLTYIDHKIFIAISSEEFLGQAWMKTDKDKRAPHIIMMTKRFNDVSRLVASEILRRHSASARAAAIEKWTAVADIARCLHNFNGVLQICSAFTNTSIFRLKKTWEKVSKTTRHTIEKLQNIVSSDGRFRSLRDALHRCDPPCIPYLGLYLTDLSFIEEGTPNFTADGLLNFSKMRMIAHVIREIRHFQQTPYKIELIQRVADYLMDNSLTMDDEALYSTSLELEPRTSRLVSQSSTTTLKS
ncbi:hypothetical protein NQ314_020317 [Rhamnusium bicolor]|uniref:Ras guanine nucleotide exchange factor n=1 Tax=Rhamnusium bicolor TaxID=1586634 RepID=A0AAV8WLG8_9CUCU|nr:hypothetical protein NQ314_020317 [Rhamnusium bicolor]